MIFFSFMKNVFFKKNNRWEELIKFAFPTAFIQELIKTKFVSPIGGETVREFCIFRFPSAFI